MMDELNTEPDPATIRADAIVSLARHTEAYKKARENLADAKMGLALAQRVVEETQEYFEKARHELLACYERIDTREDHVLTWRPHTSYSVGDRIRIGDQVVKITSSHVSGETVDPLKTDLARNTPH